jgi:hypothetical protein
MKCIEKWFHHLIRRRILNGSFIFCLILCAFALLAPAADVSAKMYRWVDQNGKVHFTDDPAHIPEEFREKPGGTSKPKETKKKADTGYTKTPLHHAALSGDTSKIERLVDGGADINAFDGNGMTALHFAAEKGRLPAVKLLLNMGARDDLRNQEGKTAADLARARGMSDVAGLLERHRAKREKKQARWRPPRPDPVEDSARATGAARSGSAVDFDEFEFVERRGRPGHQGFFKTRHPLVPGAKVKGEATIFGEVSGLMLELVDEAGVPFTGSARKPVPESADSWNYLADFRIPDRPFRVMMSGTNEKGEAVSRVYQERFDPNPSLVNLTLSTDTNARKCVTAMNLLAYPFASERGAGETLFVSCPIPKEETPNPELDIIMTAYAVAPPPGGSERVVFVSHPKQKFNKNRCWAALDLLDSLKKDGKRRELQFGWKADCRDGGGEVRLVLEWNLSAGKSK